MAIKTTPITLANSTLTTGTTFTLSVVAPVIGMDLKRETTEACIVVDLIAFSGTTPTVAFDVYEFVDANWIHVGTTGSFSTIGTAVIDSGGGSTSSGGTTFTATSALRLLGKGVNTKVVTSFAGTIGTAQYVVDYIGYNS